MAKTFRPWQVEQRWLLPPSIQEMVPEGHVAHFIRELVREELDLSEIFDEYEEERGFPPFNPGMMTALLLYAYCHGVYSSRRIASGCVERVDFMAVTARQQPDFRTVNKFRKRHLKALSRLFAQVLRLCQRADMVSLGHVALDGTKMKANASKRKAMSYGRMKQTEDRLAQEVQQWFDKARTVDESEDAEFGDARGDELPDWVTSKERRREKIREAMAALEAEAAPNDDDPKSPSGGPSPSSQRDDTPKPKDTAQRNFTDPQSKIMKGPEGFIQGYNCQAAVDSQAQIIVAHTVVATQADSPQLAAMVDQIKANTGKHARELSADAGYCSEANLSELRRRRIRGYIATARQTHGSKKPRRRKENQGPLTCAMRTTLKRGGHRSRYRLRKQIVEPVFGHIKQARSFRTFLLRGRDHVSAEWSLLCTAHNLLKLAARR
jgi:transposase